MGFLKGQRQSGKVDELGQHYRSHCRVTVFTSSCQSSAVVVVTIIITKILLQSYSQLQKSKCYINVIKMVGEKMKKRSEDCKACCVLCHCSRYSRCSRRHAGICISYSNEEKSRNGRCNKGRTKDTLILYHAYRAKNSYSPHYCSLFLDSRNKRD